MMHQGTPGQLSICTEGMRGFDDRQLIRARLASQVAAELQYIQGLVLLAWCSSHIQHTLGAQYAQPSTGTSQQ